MSNYGHLLPVCGNIFVVLQELTLRMEKMTDDAAKKKRELEHELTLTMTAQVSRLSKDIND